jgi:hypothetical protein
LGRKVAAVYARFSLHTADPKRLDEVISHYEDDVRTVFAHEPGYRGMSVLVNDDLGVALVEAYWGTEKEMRSNDVTFADPVHDAAFFGATVSIEHYEVASFVHAAPAHPGATVSITRLHTEPTSADDVRAAYGGIGLASLAASDGLCTAVRFVDPQSGKGVVETIWRDGPALVAARGAAAERRLEAASAKTVTVLGMEQYRLDFHSVELE